MMAWDSSAVSAAVLLFMNHTFFKLQRIALLSCVLVFSLSACSNSDNSDKTPNPQPPSVQKSASTGETIELSASEAASDSVANSSIELSFEWTFISKPEGSLAVLSDANAANPVFVADVEGEYVLQLIIKNNGVVLVETTVTVVVDSNNENDHTDPANPDKPTNPTNPDQPSGPGDPTDPNNPTDPTDQNVPQQPATHLLTTDNCGSCHDPVTWAIAAMDHNEVMGTCVSCHNGENARGKPANHIATTNLCDACHEPGPAYWIPATPVDHSQVIGECVSCHNATVINDFRHPFSVSEDCGACHNTTSWAPTVIDHNDVVGTCVSCHDGILASGKTANHIPSTDLCDACHQPGPTPWAPVAPSPVDHTQVIGECADCHNGPIPIPIDFVHPIDTTDNCSACHNTTSWSPARVDHREVLGTCASCHDSVLATGKGLNHVPTTQDCHACHGTVRWVASAVDHSTFLIDACINCHNGQDASGKTVTHIDTTNVCGACHNPFPDMWTPAALVDHRQVVGTCSSCHNGVIAPGKSDVHMATSDECDTCHVVDNINLTWLITDQACIGIPVLAGTLNQTAPLNFQAYPDVSVTFSTKEFHYDLDANCIPVFVELTNYGTDPVVLDSTQAAALSDLTTAYYGPFLKIPLAHESGLPVQPGLFLEPGASTYFSTIFSRERFELYSNPPLGGGLVRYERNIEGPSTSTGILGRRQFTISFDVDFGPLPTSRVYDPGAGTSFVGGELLVAFHDGVTLEEAESVVRRLNCHIKSVNLFDSIGWISVYIPFDRTTSEMESTFRREPEVRLTEKDTIISIDPISGGGGGFTIQPVF